MEVEVCWSGQSRQGIEDQMSRDERRLLRLTAVLDEPFAELADADRALHGMWPPPWATAFQKDMFGQLRDAYRDAVQLQSVARTEVRARRMRIFGSVSCSGADNASRMPLDSTGDCSQVLRLEMK